MARPLVQAEGISKGYAGRTLFEGVSFSVQAGERVAVVGPNGSGKSTLLHILGRRIEPDVGSIMLAPHVPLAFFTQHHEVKPKSTVRDVLIEGTGVPPAIAEELQHLEARMADPALYESSESETVIARYGELQAEAAKANATGGGYDAALALQLGYAEDDLGRPADKLSGGELTRLFLARILGQADPTGLLVLDEPTNHLDVETIEWLEEWLFAYQGAVMIVAHDRAFLDNVATSVLSLERGGATMYAGNYSEFERRRDEDATRLAAQREREKKELNRQKSVIEQFKHQKRFNGQMASRLVALQKYRASIDKTPDPLFEKVRFSVTFQEAFKSSNEVVRVRGLGKRFGERVLFYGLDFDLTKGDRIGLVGPNGVGKSTLLRILVGKEKKDVGNIETLPGVKGAYHAQGHENLRGLGTLHDEVASTRQGLAAEDVRALLGRFGFRDPQDPQRKVTSLSGGERARLSLLRTVLEPSNLLILDEPTNHLDLESRQTLVRALNAYEGTLLVVSHDRWFLDSVVSKVAVMGSRTVQMFPGDFTQAREAAAMAGFSTTKPTAYLVKKAFKDFDSSVKHTVGETVELTESELSTKRLYRTALQMGWIEEIS